MRGSEECRLIVYGGARRLEEVLDRVKEKVYEYNTIAGRHGYYLKPVHKVYRRTSQGVKVYEYYGRYYWRRAGNRLVYAGTVKPRGLPDPEPLGIEGLSVIRVNDEDIVVDCTVYDRFKTLFQGLKAERY